MELLQKMPSAMVGIFKEVLDERQIGGGELTIAHFQRELFDPFSQCINERLDKISSTPVKAKDTEKPKSQSLFDWGQGHFCRVPKDYVLNKKLWCLDVWICWHIGKQKKGTAAGAGGKVEYLSPPWKALTLCDLKPMPSMKSYCTFQT
jgi:hypothetical protein